MCWMWLLSEKKPVQKAFEGCYFSYYFMINTYQISTLASLNYQQKEKLNKLGQRHNRTWISCNPCLIIQGITCIQCIVLVRRTVSLLLVSICKTQFATSVMKDKKMERKDRELLKGFPSFLGIHCRPLTVILPVEEAAAPSSFCSSADLGNSALCFYGWLETILSFFYIFPNYSHLM